MTDRTINSVHFARKARTRKLFACAVRARRQNPSPMTNDLRTCMGGRTEVCRQKATVICTERDGGAHPLQWFACDNPLHRTGAHVEPIAEWFTRNGLPVPEGHR
jgi:hypothetical protein